jgi:hypothetical protein
MSQHDIEAGSRWGNELGIQLEEANFGIICITPENIAAPWLLYEAGCLGKSIEQSRVIPYRIDIAAADVPFPLAQFQNVNADKEGTLKLLESINSVNSSKLEPERLKRLFEKLWQDFEKTILDVGQITESTSPKRTDRDLLEEMLQIMRGIDRDLKRLPEVGKLLPEPTPVDTPAESNQDKATGKAPNIKAGPSPKLSEPVPDDEK